MSFLSNLSWRYATKKFDSTKKISAENIEKVLEAIRMTPTSFGLQPYHFYVVTNQEIKDKIQAVAWNQPQVGTCSHLIVFAVRTDLKQTKEEYFTLMSGGNPEIRAHLK
jgi:nitroreductase / dihydropteridine reductase